MGLVFCSCIKTFCCAVVVQTSTQLLPRLYLIVNKCHNTLECSSEVWIAMKRCERKGEEVSRNFDRQNGLLAGWHPQVDGEESSPLRAEFRCESAHWVV